MTVDPITRRINRGRGHSYLLDGADADGVTWITGNGIPKPALVNWAADESAKYVLNYWDDLVAMPPGDRYKAVLGARYSSQREATARGTDIHQLVQRHLAGEEISEDEPLRGHMDAYEQFLEEWGVDELLVEVTVINRRYRYMGTLDLVARLRDGQTWLLDWKTGKRVYAESALQLAAYRHAETVLVDGQEQPMPHVDQAGCIWLRADGADLVPVDTSDDVFKAFLYAQQVARFVKAADNGGFLGDTLRPPASR